MPQHWIKPLGVTEPFRPMPNAWTVGRDLDDFRFTTGPKKFSQPPKMGTGDLVIFHAVHHARVFAAATITGDYGWRQEKLIPPDDRWPWVYPCRVTTWVDLIEHGPKASDVAPRRAVGSIQVGGAYAKLMPEEYQAVLTALRASPYCRDATESSPRNGQGARPTSTPLLDDSPAGGQP